MAATPEQRAEQILSSWRFQDCMDGEPRSREQFQKLIQRIADALRTVEAATEVRVWDVARKELFTEIPSEGGSANYRQLCEKWYRRAPGGTDEDH